jgi:hypothetical protein
MPGGTTSEGYSRDYSPQERLTINQTWLDNQHDPVFSVVLDAYLKRKKECHMTPKR